MVLAFSISHVFQVPVEKVVRIYFRNHGEFRNMFGELTEEKELEHTYREEDGLSCVKTILTYTNFIPKLARKIPHNFDDRIIVEEECWMDMVENYYWVRLRNVTLNDNISILRTSAFTRDPQNPAWTRYECDGAVEFQNWGLVGQGIEAFMRNSMKKIVLGNIKLLTEKINESQKDVPELDS